MKVELVRYPSWEDWKWCKECALGTMGKESKTLPTDEWMHNLLKARHSPIRELEFSFVLRDIPYWVSVHLVRHHVGINCYVQSQRNDRQNDYDRNAARQDAPVTMRITLNAEALMTLANKRLCQKAAPETREVVKEMCTLVLRKYPQFDGLLVPMCVYHNGVCQEMRSCGRWDNDSDKR